MFCPKCSLQQPTDGGRFCPRCGFPLAGVAALLAGNDLGAALTPAAARVPEPTAKRAGVRRGAKLMFFGVVLAPAFLGLSFLVDSPAPLFVPFTVFLAGLAWLAYFLLFGEELLPGGSFARGRELKSGRDAQALAPPPFVPAPDFNRPPLNTSEIAKPPSVTEHTTKLFGKDA